MKPPFRKVMSTKYVGSTSRRIRLTLECGHTLIRYASTGGHVFKARCKSCGAKEESDK